MNWMRQRVLILQSPFHSFFLCNCHGESCLFELGAEAIYKLKLVWCAAVKNYQIHFVTSLLCSYEPHKITVYQHPMYSYINLTIWVFDYCELATVHTCSSNLSFHPLHDPKSGSTWCQQLRIQTKVDDMLKAYIFYSLGGFKALRFCCLKQQPWRSGMDFSYDAPPFWLKCVRGLIRWWHIETHSNDSVKAYYDQFSVF